MTRELFSGFIRIHILHHANEGEVYGLWLMEELAKHGYAISPGTLYPTLHGLEKAGYLVSEKRVTAGRQRRYYAITPAGKAALAEARTRLQELVGEVLESQNQTLEAQ